MKIIPGKRYIVTGGSGFLGTALIKRIIEEGGIVRTIARNEGKLITLQELYGDKIEIVPGDIGFKFHCWQLMNCEFEGVFHLAAFKHVPMAEKFPFECTHTNVIGSDNVIAVGVDKKAKFIIGISTDKAAQVAGVYGATKLLMEKLFQESELIFPDTKFRIVRYGNVLYSTGSVLCKWKDAIQQGKDVMITNKRATRFFWTLDQAVQLIFDCLEYAEDSTPYVPAMKAMSMGSLLNAMILKYAPDPHKIKVHEIGLQKGENMHERILEGGPASNEVELFTIAEIQALI